jgi:hypothetical protein
VIKQGRNLPKEVIDCWPEVFGEVKLRVLPLRYLYAVLIAFKDGKTWEVKITPEDQMKGWDSFEGSLSELLKTYEKNIESIDFKLDTNKIKKDIERSTRRFLKKKKL